VEVRPLLEDGSLRLEAHPSLLPSLDRWLPLLPADGPVDAAGAVLSLVPASGPPAAAPSGPRTLSLGGVEAWTERDHAFLSGAAGIGGSVDLAALRAEIRAPVPGAAGPAAERAARDLHSACTVAASLLLGRLSRALAHAAAIVPPSGGAWLLVGDARAGKTTTCATLLSAGWRYLSDDHVVVRRGADAAVEVEGWPRPFHLDEGWERGDPAPRRGATDPRHRWPGRWRRSAPVAGLLFPRVVAGEATRLEEIDGADALAALLRQSPWLLADRRAAPAVLALLRDAAALPSARLTLGRDAYAAPRTLTSVLEPLTG
jgi:hypothetical protein